MLRITGYTDRWVFEADDEVHFKISSKKQRIHWRLVRHIGPIKESGDWAKHTVDVGVTGFVDDCAERKIISGSRFVAAVKSPKAAALSVRFRVLPTATRIEGSVLCEMEFDEGDVCLRMDGDGRLQVAGVDSSTKLLDGLRLVSGEWQEIVWTVVPETGTTEVTLHRNRYPALSASVDVALTRDALTELRLAGDRDSGKFNGKLENPELSYCEAYSQQRPAWVVLGSWDFGSYEAGQFEITDKSGNGFQARLLNAPTRAVTSSRYDGRNHDFRTNPDGYQAVWFHDDDTGDVGWPTTLVVGLPHLPSGAYSVLVSEDEVPNWSDRASFDAIPFFVRPGRSTGARVALVLPTFSYRAYANNTFAEHADPRIFRRRNLRSSVPLYSYAIENNLLSLYSVHSDGSGVALASLKRPQVTIRADFNSQLQGFAHQFSADLEIVAWLGKVVGEFDILTDEVLHVEGSASLENYDVVITGSHPEYASASVLNAYDDYLRLGRSLMYLGGNGFYWSVGLDGNHPEFVEVRRSEGTRTWTSGIGERRQQLDGSDGGLWRSLGRPPNATFGIGFCAHGFSGDGDYKLVADVSVPPELKRTMACIASIGDRPFGIAGLEVDRFAVEFGSPRHAVVLASLNSMPDDYLPTVEEFGGLDELIPDAKVHLSGKVKGDIVLISNYPGYVFSIGSIRWTSGLNSGDSRVADLTTAVLLDLLNVADTHVHATGS